VKKTVLFIFAAILFGANLININFFEGKNKLDILFSLDSAFKGKVKQLTKTSFYITDIKTDKIIQKDFKKRFINSVIISPFGNGIKIDVDAKTKIKTSVALTPDGYGVRFRITDMSATKTSQHRPQQLNLQQNSGFDTFSYITGIAALLLIALVLWFLKKKTVSMPSLRENMKLLAQKPIDPKNKIVLFEYQDRKYLMLVGNSNVLLDVFQGDIPVPKNEAQFDEMLKLSKKYDNIEKYIQNAEKLKEFDERI